MRAAPRCGVVLLTGNGPSPKNGGWAFCTGGDQRIRGKSGYQYAQATESGVPRGEDASTIDTARAKAEGGRLHILEVQRLIRTMPKVVICLVNGWAAGGGTPCTWCATSLGESRECARFSRRTRSGSFDAGFGSAYPAKQVGKSGRGKFPPGDAHTAAEMCAMGAVIEVVPHADLETVGVRVRVINKKSSWRQRIPSLLSTGG